MNIYLVDITNADSTNGVDRYISCLLEGLTKIKSFNRIYHISFLAGSRKIFRQVEERDGYTYIQIPLPEQFGTVIGEVYWSSKYNQALYNRIRPYFESDQLSIIHTHTLNLIDFALEIKKHIPAKIITHLHCIPWKSIYNRDMRLFNKLYKQYYIDQDITKEYYTSHSEEPAYTMCDKVIACTACGTEFARRVSGISENKILIVSNGITNLYTGQSNAPQPLSSPVKLLFVGSVVAGKGIFFILESLQKVIKAGYPVELVVAGSGSEQTFELIHNKFSDVPITILGSIPFEQLQIYYKSCDIGIIGSLQEQNSYVAIEMCMFGMPIITTAIDGLDEMFIHEVNALKVPVYFDRLSGLKVDTDRMQEAIIELITSNEKRTVIAQGARRLYEQKFTLNGMTEQIVQIYQSLHK